MSIDTVGDLAVATIHVLIERDWCQGVFVMDDGKVCVLGAVNMAAYGSPEPVGNSDDYYTPAVEAIGKAMVDLGIIHDSPWVGGPSASLYVWNDHPKRKVIEVSAALMKVGDLYKDTPVDLIM